MDRSLKVCDAEYCIEVFNTSNIANPNNCGYKIYSSNDSFHLSTFAIWIIAILSALFIIVIFILILVLTLKRKHKPTPNSKPEISVSRTRHTEKSSNYQYAAIPGFIGATEEETLIDNTFNHKIKVTKAESDDELLIDRAFSSKHKVSVSVNKLPLKSRGSKRFLKTEMTVKVMTDHKSSDSSQYLPVDIQTLRNSSSFELKEAKLGSPQFTDRTQDDMIYLDLEYDNTPIPQTSAPVTPFTADDFSRISTWRVIKLFSPQQIKYYDIDFKNEEFLGKGSMGKVYKAKYNGIDVAVKKLNVKYLNLTGMELKNFKREASIMQKVGGHKHIARMYGFCTDPEICIITEYYSRGSLHDIMKNNERDYLNITLKIQIMIEASLGVLHLHQQNVIHRDISARNLLVDENWTVVVADLGMSRLKRNINVNKTFHGRNNNCKTVFGPIKWMAPESITKNEYSEKTDSYSFGITLFEILSECEPYQGMQTLEAGAKVVHEGLRPQINELKYVKKITDLGNLMRMLWKHHPKDRPDFLYIGECLKSIKSQLSSNGFIE